MKFESTQLFSRLLNGTPFSPRELHLIILTAPDRYKNHFIDKRHGRGKRLISQPTAELKYLQRLILKQELNRLVVHDAAVGYRHGMGIKNHAAPHAPQRYLLKLDFKDFFPSLKENALRHSLSRDTEFSDEELWILIQILCRRDRLTSILQLSIGAPSSPFISNYLMREFDEKLYRLCEGQGVTYTRYADDLAFSTSKPRLLDSMHQSVLMLLAELQYLALRLNDEKTVNVSTKNRRTLVGLNLSNDGIASIGREAKRNIRASMHQLSKGLLSPIQIATLRGNLAFIYSIDPDFVMFLCSRYGFNKINEVAYIRQME